MTTDPEPYAATPPAAPPPPESIRDGLRGKFVCPFCGSVNDSEQGTCPRCTMENSAATRKATKTRIGPWYVLQTRNPAAPGMTWETLVSFVRKGRVKPRSIIRGPTTHQLWRFAAHVKGLSREFGICYSCGTGVETTAALCPVCNRLQDPPPNPDALLEQSRDGQTLYGTLPPGADAATGASGAPPFGTPPFAPLTIDSPPTINDAEFVLPPLGGGATSAAANNATPTVVGPTAGPQSSSAFTPGSVAVSNVPASGYAGISGDPTWTRIGSTIPGSAPQPTNRHQGPNAGALQDPQAHGQQSVGIPAGANSGRDRNPFGSANGGGRAPNGTAAPQGPKFNPYADDDAPTPPGRRAEGGEGFLSAKDLAAAFNLSFVGEEEEEPVQRTVRGGNGGQPARGQQPAGRGANPAAMNMPVGGGAMGGAALGGVALGGVPNYNPPAAPASRGRKLKVLLVLVLLLGACGGMALAVSGELRAAVRGWWRQIMNPTPTAKPKSDNPAAKPTTFPATAQADPATRPGEVGGPGATTDPAVPAHAVVPPAAPPTSPVTRPTSRPTSRPAAPPVADPSWYRSKVAKLRSEGLSFETLSQFDAALERYNEIKSYPADTWPPDVDECIARVQKKRKLANP